MLEREKATRQAYSYGGGQSVETCVCEIFKSGKLGCKRYGLDTGEMRLTKA